MHVREKVGTNCERYDLLCFSRVKEGSTDVNFLGTRVPLYSCFRCETVRGGRATRRSDTVARTLIAIRYARGRNRFADEGRTALQAISIFSYRKYASRVQNAFKAGWRWETLLRELKGNYFISKCQNNIVNRSRRTERKWALRDIDCEVNFNFDFGDFQR